MSRNETHLSHRLAVRAACHARISFDVSSPRRADILVDHLSDRTLLAREVRPLAAGSGTIEIKTHPDASHVTCLLQVDGNPIEGVRFSVECNQGIEPTPRNFIVIGAMKAGTTTLFRLLAQHPALCRTWVELPGVSSTKEINYFRRLYRKGDTRLHYDWRFPFDSAKHAWTLDVSPGYAQWPSSKGVPARIASLGGKTKLAYILREPIDRIESHLAHRLHHHGKTSKLNHCVRTSRYAMQLDKFMAHIERDDMLLLDFGQLRKKPAVVLAQICDFLAINRLACRSVIHNTRGIEFRLDASQRETLAELVRPDVQRLIQVYGFKPAEKWLRKPLLHRMGLSAFRR